MHSPGNAVNLCHLPDLQISVPLASQKRIHETIIAHRKDFLSAFQYCSNLSNDIDSALNGIDEEELPQELSNEVQSLKVLAEVHNLLMGFESLLEIGEFKVASGSIVQMVYLGGTRDF